MVAAAPPRRSRAARLLAAALLPALSGCAVFTTMISTPGRTPRARPLPVAGTDLFDWKGVVHCHSYLSHDSDGQIVDIVAGCHAADIDFLVMTDHQTDASIRDGLRGVHAGVLFVVGAEVRTPRGTIMAFPLTAPLRRWQNPAALVAEAQAQGGIAMLCHAERPAAWNVPGIAGVEIVILHAGAAAANRPIALLTALLLPLRFLFEQFCRREPFVFAQWDVQLAERHPFTPVGGDDAHANVRMLGPLGGTVGTYREVFLTLSTHVLSERLDEASLVEALRSGRTYVSFDIFGEGAGFDFRAVDAGGVHVGGATVTAGPELRLRVRTPSPGRIELWRDGAIVQRADGDALELAAPPPGVYRVEVRTRFGSPWLFSSSIRVVAPAADRVRNS